MKQKKAVPDFLKKYDGWTLDGPVLKIKRMCEEDRNVGQCIKNQRIFREGFNKKH